MAQGRFIEPRQNKEQLMEGKRPFRESKRPRVAEWKQRLDVRIAIFLKFYISDQFRTTDLKSSIRCGFVTIQAPKLAPRMDQLKMVAFQSLEGVVREPIDKWQKFTQK